MKPMKPVTPKDLEPEIPNEVISAFNKLIRGTWNNYRATFKEHEVVAQIYVNFKDSKRKFKEHEICALIPFALEIYQKAGWRITNRKPTLKDLWAAYYVFEKVELIE